MLFGIIVTPKADTTEKDEKRVLQLFANWNQPSGYEIKSHYLGSDGGTIIIAEASSAEAVSEASAPWHAYFDMKVTPVVEIAKSVEISQKAFAWRDSVK